MYEFMIHMIIACVFGVCMGGCIVGWVIIIKNLIRLFRKLGHWIKAKDGQRIMTTGLGGRDPARLLSLEEMYEELIYGR
jgi:hypothetical protein